MNDAAERPHVVVLTLKADTCSGTPVYSPIYGTTFRIRTPGVVVFIGTAEACRCFLRKFADEVEDWGPVVGDPYPRKNDLPVPRILDADRLRWNFKKEPSKE